MKKLLMMMAALSLLTFGMVSCDRNDDTTDNLTTNAFDQNGASYAAFSVAKNKTVHFSKGNLQYQASTNTWRFAAHQYDCIGDDNAKISSVYSGWIDLFGWGTSGWNSGANAYQPWSTNTNCSDYYPGGYDTVSLTGDYANADWGVYNRIINGGNKTGMWRTLTKDEWDYLLFTRNTSPVYYTENARFAKATIGNVTGLIVFPDTIEQEILVLPSSINNMYTYFSDNTYTTEEWSQLEAIGIIFLPTAGDRYSSSSIAFEGMLGKYWTSSCGDEEYAYELFFDNKGEGSNNIGMVETGLHRREYGLSVRLVKD